MTASAEKQLTSEGIERLDRAQAAFVAVLGLGLQPTLTAEVQDGNDWRHGEYDIAIEPTTYGVLHEQLQEVLAIAERHGGRVWLGQPDQKLSILFPYVHPQGPGDEESPTESTRRRSRAKAVKA